MQRIPDIIGLELSCALPILDEKNCMYSITETLSPKVTNKDGECRIINLREKNDTTFELIVSFF